MLAYGTGALLLLRVYGNGIYTCSADYNYTFVCADYINQRVFFKTELSVSIIAGLVVCVIGMGSAGTGYLIYVRGVKYLGPTISSLFSNFLPVTSTFFGWLILGQSLGVMQIAGGLIVIVSACYVIIEKSRLEKQELKLRLENEIK